MTVGELIKELSLFPTDKPVYVICENGGGSTINIGFDADALEVYLIAYEEEEED